ncbi:alpha-ketoacid dehydrogenase subunit beta [Microbacterium sp. SORGH_AS_0888]|uniref:alpha-ketoacid dehydrogenase subunit beta n=1 Tax=Microbacterium sp. SORGH_AS_0888 TaxID=3041791 RepID=UPI002789F955|nr:transketolase C-terminal domain-containing protein [Microbacterium sp. SORGH_AS_0888]MDQ1130487.1 pyruvate/2-oxoglutarate/acetoin dehydrogenase E1 component [Microbacterium sp. SORGH_AS_0888]
MTVTAARNINVSQATAEGLRLEMEADASVLVIGEDVAAQGGVFGSTRGLLKAFGPGRVLDTPISEMAFTGMAVGLAMEGYRPVVEIMFVDFIGVCLEQVYNAIAKIPYMSGGRVPMPVVIKTAGGSIGAAAQHSQTLWGLFAHLPGLRVVAPSNPYDSKGMIAAAVRSDDPVVFIEHKGLLLQRAADFAFGAAVPKECYDVPLDRAAVVRPGADLTLVTLSGSVRHAVAAAAAAADRGVDVEVVDLRSVVPIDWETVCGSAARTRRLLVVDEDYLGFGLSGELITGVVERLGLGALDHVARHGTPDVPVPAALSLEREIVPGADSILAAVLRAAGGTR